jgi:membrane fusion protein
MMEQQSNNNINRIPSTNSLPSSGRNIFREESLTSLQPRLQGDVILTPRMSMWLWCLIALIALAALTWFATQGTYTRRNTVSGQLVPATGLMRVQTPQTGVIVERNVIEGQIVRKGDVLYVISSDRMGSNTREIQLDIRREIETRQLSLKNEIARNQKDQNDEIKNLDRRISALQADSKTIDRQLELQKQRVAVAQDTKNRYQELAEKDYIAKEQLTQKELDLSEQLSRLQALERDVQATKRDLATADRDIGTAKSRYANLNSNLQRSISTAQQDLTEVEARRRVVITAPEDGRVTLVAGEIGQVADVARPLLSILPIKAVLQARLFAPSRAIGFVRPGDKVWIRYQAYPYQKFGLHEGKVTAISTASVANSELAGFALPDLTVGEPVYGITVDLLSQNVMAYGVAQPLQAGLRLDADILQETRRLYEWVLEPLYSITGKMAR